MIVRKYNRRNRSLTRNCSQDSAGFEDDVVSDDFENNLISQESPPDIYTIAFSSQGSSANWGFDSDTYGFNGSQDSGQIAILPKKKPEIGGDFGDDFRVSKRGRSSFDFDDDEGLDSFQKSGRLEGFKRNQGNGGLKRVKKGGGKKGKDVRPVFVAEEQTKTLMETQEFGEMMEHEDEVYFAMEGLRKGQPVRIRRASLLSLLSICATAQQRRLLRTNGTAKIILDAVMRLSFDDPPSNLAAAALFYILTSDGHDDHLMDSPSCIRFLMKMLKPVTSNTATGKAPSIGCRLLALKKDTSNLQDSNGIDSSSTAILVKVQEILVSCKQMKSVDGKGSGREKVELNPKWISLLTMEKACLSTISFEDTTGNVRKTGGNFKEKFREHGGLDAVFDVARQCHSNVERWLADLSTQILESKDDVNLESLVLLLKCLKVMENATFLSQDNQSHLLGMKSKFNTQHQPQSFTEHMLSTINILSGVSLLLSTCGSSEGEKLCSSLSESQHAHERPIIISSDERNDEILSIISSMEGCTTQWNSSQKSSNISQNSQLLSSTRAGFFKSSSKTITSSPTQADTHLLKIRDSASTSSSCNGTLNSNSETRESKTSWLKLGIHKKIADVSENTKLEHLEESLDPFAFHEDEFEPSKWDLLSVSEKVPDTKKRRSPVGEYDSLHQSQLILIEEDPSSMESQTSPKTYLQASCSSAVDLEKSILLSDCLLTAVKVLMNLTNDNPIGCRQIAACGGLETLSSLIVGHFPLFSSYLPPLIDLPKQSLSSKSVIEFDHENNVHLTDEELDFLVAILGLLVNLVEKDGQNRSRLAAISVSIPRLKGSENETRDVIPLLCSIFLANQGAGEAAEEGRTAPSDDEDVLLQGEKEAEKMIVEAYSALLLAFLSTESQSIRNAIANCLPNHKLTILVPVLERFVEFHLTLNMISPETHSTVLEVIESCRMQ